MNGATLDRQVERKLEALRREFADVLPAGHVDAIGAAQLERLRPGARILDFIPLLVYRYTREELVLASQEELRNSA